MIKITKNSGIVCNDQVDKTMIQGQKTKKQSSLLSMFFLLLIIPKLALSSTVCLFETRDFTYWLELKNQSLINPNFTVAQIIMITDNNKSLTVSVVDSYVSVKTSELICDGGIVK